MGNSNSIHKLFSPLFLFITFNSFATHYYVSSTGSDANPGTSMAAPWATLAKVNSTQFFPGDALYFEGGKTFNGSINLVSSDANDPNNLFVISSYGVGRATINAGTSNGFYALNTQGFSVSNLILDGVNPSTNVGAGVLIFSDLSGDIKFSNISISNMEIKNFGGEGVKIYTTQNLTGFQDVTLANLSVHDVTKNGIIVFGYIAQSLIGWQHKNVSVSNCEVYNVPGSSVPANFEGSGIVLEGVDGGFIQNCVAHDNGNNNTFCGGPAGIWTLESNNITIQYCESYRNHSGTGCDGAGLDLDGGVTNSVLQYNYSHDNDGAGYLLGQYDHARPWSNNTMRYNISENDGITNEGGIGVFKGPGTMMDKALIYNNTVYISPQVTNSAESAVYFSNWVTGMTNVAFYNNVFYSTGNTPLVNIPVGYSAFFAGNIYWPSGGAFRIYYQGVQYTSLASWRTATGNEIVAANPVGWATDPMLANVGAGGDITFGTPLNTLTAYKINNISSPAYNSAFDLNSQFSINAGSVDFWGTVLPGGLSNGVGANQFVSVLPIQLLGFHGSCSGSEQRISWNTAEESNIKSIDLLQSGDGRVFSAVAEIKPKGSNSSYSYINDQILPGDNYYQLKMTDLDGRVSYSSILNISCTKSGNTIKTGPNPFSQMINVSIESDRSGPVTMSLFDVMGKMQIQKVAELQQGSNVYRLEGTGNLPAGTYYLRITHEDKSKFVKLIKSAN